MIKINKNCVWACEMFFKIYYEYSYELFYEILFVHPQTPA